MSMLHPEEAAPAAPSIPGRQLLSVEALTVTYGPDSGFAAVRDVSLEVGAGEAVGLVGESGSGKSTIAAALIGLLPRGGRITAGSMTLEGRELTDLGERDWRGMRGRRIAMVFQEASTALNPLMTVGGHLRETLRVTRGLRGSAADRAARDLLGEVGLSDPDQRLRQYSHELSGGMRQRVQIAIALAGDPVVLIADEPTTALDVTVQAQILTLLRARQQERGMALLLISHSLAVVASVVDRAFVLYGGRVMETGPTQTVFESPRHPYTHALLEANLHVDRDSAIRPVAGAPPSAAAMPPGCPFAPRCSFAEPSCHEQPPPPLAAVGHDRAVACPVDPLREQ